jgi:hypothetical protein
LDWQYPEKGASKRKKNNGEKYKNYKRKRNEITDLDISRQSLSDNLKLTKFDNLVKLDCP